MKLRLALAVLCLPILAYAGDRALSLLSTIQLLNGSPTAIGMITADAGATSLNNCTTGTAFDGGLGDALTITCSVDVWMKTGTCATTAAVTDQPVLAGTEKTMMLKTGQMAVAIRNWDAGLWGTCYVGHLQ